MIFFLCFLRKQFLIAETQGSEGVLMSILNVLTAKKSMLWSVSEEYPCKLRCLTAYWKGLDRGYPRLKQQLDQKHQTEVICHKLLTNRREG